MLEDPDQWLNSAARKPDTAHELGQNLDSLSIVELEERIRALKQEIVRLEAAKADKENSAGAAAGFFKI